MPLRRIVCSLRVQGTKSNQCQSPKFPDLNELDLKETHSLTKTNLPCSGIWKSLSQPDRRSPKQHRFSGCFCWWKKILHELIGSLSHDLQGFIPPRWSRISSINRMSSIQKTRIHQPPKMQLQLAPPLYDTTTLGQQTSWKSPILVRPEQWLIQANPCTEMENRGDGGFFAEAIPFSPKKIGANAKTKRNQEMIPMFKKKMAHVRFNHKFLHRNWCFVVFSLQMWVPGVSSDFSSTSTGGRSMIFLSLYLLTGVRGSAGKPSWNDLEKRPFTNTWRPKKNTYEKNRWSEPLPSPPRFAM